MEEKFEDLLASEEVKAVEFKGAIVEYIVALIIGVVLSVGVALPIATQTIADANVTGTALTILNIVPIFIALIPVVMVAGYYRFMSGGA
jgi:uncharacterized membrane-anchored protein YitT (DUF2179 family)